MPIQNHSLAIELPEFKDQIHDLKTTNLHFHRLFNEYHDIDKDIHRIENGIQNTSDQYLNGLKLERLHLKDEMLALIHELPA